MKGNQIKFLKLNPTDSVDFKIDNKIFKDILSFKVESEMIFDDNVNVNFISEDNNKISTSIPVKELKDFIVNYINNNLDRPFVFIDSSINKEIV